MTYPEYVRIAGEKVKIKSDTRTALRCLKICTDCEIGDHERGLAIIYTMYGEIPKNSDLWEEYLIQAVKFLQCGEENKEADSEPDMDILYDQKYINASFMSDYHIDLSKTNPHFWQFCNLIAGLTEGSILQRVRHIRSCDINDYADKDQAEIRAAKEALALPHRLTREEKELDDAFEALFEVK